MPPGMKLGEYGRWRSRRVGTRREIEALEPRASVVLDDELELEPVWWPHRDAASLLPADGVEGHQDYSQVRGAVVGISDRTPRWRFTE